MKWWFRFVGWFNRKAKSFSIRLVKWTGKSSEYVHPKHLIEDTSHYWFIPFLKKEDRVLDLGTGSGSHALQAALCVQSVVAVDGSERNIEIAKRLSLVQKINNVEFQLADLECPIGGPDHSYTVIMALDVLEHLTNRDQFLNEASRLLRAGGRLLLSVPNRETSWKKKLACRDLFFYSDLDHKYEYTEKEIREILNQYNYRIIFFDVTVYDTPLAGMIDVIGGFSVSLYQKLMKWKRDRAVRNRLESTGFRIVAEKKE